MTETIDSQSDSAIDTESLSRMYTLMLTTALADQKSVAESKAGRLQAAFYPVRGMEAVCAALGEVLTPRDRLVSTYRNLGDALAKGTSLRAIMAEMYGRKAGLSRGKGGPMHLQDPAIGFTATTGIVGSGLPIAAGLAMAAQLDGSGIATVVTFGDGATSIGAFHEAMNFAGLWQLPLVFVCQNNQWGEHTPIASYAANTDLTARAAAYAMRAEKIDGFDPMAARSALDAAVRRARAGEGPTFLEFTHYRLTGHTGTADFSYVPKAELEAAMERDPAPTFRRWLQAQGHLTEDQLSAIEERAHELVEDAFVYAAGCELPAASDVYTDVFADDTWVRSLHRD
ncbi:thiamine pyrophosphate-dependent dehydrogenase E1 component subunit alpha [Mycolicibacterium neoaurum]|uniref:thiamine pyrophosphate-dependent dehydrogenase E1 component subunit alpha n=1 Tax=Mycolicibacterium neoaurum TaxID=1795 RepID=UPI00267414D7|nr:thiamine pyrophosphate-dependent dehydrogenase E1 component subunit alpha [Mycolicibacterium neoaurum]MDO3402736.1 thiamine pyrophosphate-dependent dehydrogenase E1 component subunit alpha [Mycolicibacterium neoaurum]